MIRGSSQSQLVTCETQEINQKSQQKKRDRTNFRYGIHNTKKILCLSAFIQLFEGGGKQQFTMAPVAHASNAAKPPTPGGSREHP